MHIYGRFLRWALSPIVSDIKAEIEREAREREVDMEALRKGAGFMKAYPGAVTRTSDGAVFRA